MDVGTPANPANPAAAATAMKTCLLGLALLLLLPSCSEEKAVPVYGPVIVLHPPAVVHTHPRPSLPIPPVPPATADDAPLPAASGSVYSNYHTAQQLATAYVSSPGVTVDGLRRARVLSLAADRAIVLMQRHKPARKADADHAAAAVSELLELVK